MGGPHGLYKGLACFPQRRPIGQFVLMPLAEHCGELSKHSASGGFRRKLWVAIRPHRLQLKIRQFLTRFAWVVPLLFCIPSKQAVPEPLRWQLVRGVFRQVSPDTPDISRDGRPKHGHKEHPKQNSSRMVRMSSIHKCSGVGSVWGPKVGLSCVANASSEGRQHVSRNAKIA